MNCGKGGDYNIVEFGLNCAPDAIIENKDTCEDALNEFGISVANLYVNTTVRPAGCYWKSNNKGFFNSVVNTTLTEPSLFGERGGVCRRTGSGRNKKNRTNCIQVTIMISCQEYMVS